MADAFRQMQKSFCSDGRPNGGTFPYGCPCCRKIANLRKFKKWTRKQARVKVKRLDDDFLGTRR